MTESRGRALTPEQAGRAYDRIGRLQDWQRFYESPATDDLVGHADFESAGTLFELGCGTGEFARRLLEHHLRPTATYHGVDVSGTMVKLATERLAPWADRAEVTAVTGALPLPGGDSSVDRFVAAYVFDLLDGDYAARVLDEAARLLTPDGRLCLVSLTEGATAPSRILCRAWNGLWARAPALVGGCRPVTLEPLLADRWDLLHRRVVTAWAVSSEIVVATPRAT